MATELNLSDSPLLQQAVDNYRRQYGAVGGLSRYQLSLPELLEDVARLEQEPKSAIGARTYTITSRLQGVIAFVERYAPAIDCLVQTCSGSVINPATLVWGLIRVLLEVASSVTRYYPSLLGLLDELNTAVSIYSSYEEIFFQHPRFQQALVEVYTDIIAILDKARRVLTQGKYKMLWRSLKTKFETDFKNNLDSIKKHLAALESETTLAHRKEMHLFAAESRAGLANDGRDVNNDTEERIYRWLAPLDCEARLAEIDLVRHAGSCSWLLDHKDYLAWKMGNEKQILWISGPPGIGKTVLSSAMIADIRDTYLPAPACIAMFHCDASNQQSRSMDILFASIIAQMASKVPPEHLVHGIPSCLANAYQKSIRFGRKSLSKADSPQDVIATMALFMDTWVVIDGLDEMDQPERAQELLNISSLVGAAFRIAVLSRSTSTIKKVFADIPQIQIQPSHVQNDIHQYIKARSKELPLDEEAARQQVAQAVNAKADGMFLWTRLVMEDLTIATCLADIEEILLQYPIGLSGVYDRFLSGMVSQSIYRQHLARDILQWVCCAFRPLNMPDLDSALSTNTSGGRFENGTGSRPSRQVIMDICGPFLVLNDTIDTLRPVHQSFREYLIGPQTPLTTPEAARFLIHPGTAHSDLALRCIRYLKSKPFFSAGISGGSDDFWDYAMTYWCQHTVKGSYNEELESGIYDLIYTAGKRQHWLHWMLFGYHGSPFSFTNIFRLQAELRDWARPSTREDSLKRLTRKDWNMDCLELLIKATRRREAFSKLSNTYFEIMMVARDLVRRLKRDAQLTEAITRLENSRTALGDHQNLSELGFIYNLLGMLHDQTGHVQLALRSHQTARSIQESLDNKSNTDVLWTMNEIGRMYRHIGLLDDSERMHRHVLDHLTADLPEDHPELIWTINTLATTLREQNRAEEALALHMQAYDSRSKSLGESHAHTLWSCSDVAKCYQSQRSFTTALIWYQKTLDGRASTLGLEDPDTLWSMNHLGMVLADLGRHFEAVEIHEQALEAQERVLGLDHEHTCWTRNIISALRGKMESCMVLC